MAIILKKPAGVKPAPAPQEAAKPAPKPSTQQQSAPAQKPKGAPAYLHKGKEAKEIFEKEELRKELASKGKVFRFFLKEGAEGNITFLDGNVNDGMLDATFYYEHHVQLNGKWGNFFVCTKETEPCPICNSGLYPTYVALLSVIDHTTYKGKEKDYVDTVKLFVAKQDTFKLLQKMAIKRGGLRGCKFEATRIGEKAPNVGGAFEFIEKLTEQELAQYKPLKQGDQDRSKPIDYAAMLEADYQPASALRKLGFDAGGAPIGSEPAPENYDDQV